MPDSGVAHETPVWIPLRDGRRLHARIWRPADALQRPVPAILEYIPYALSWASRSEDERRLEPLAARGFACVRVDIAGSGESDGLLADEYLQSELDDGVAVIAWIAAQPWCTGRVGMTGISWGGFNSLQIAALRPEPLKAVISACSTDDRYGDDVHYIGGCLLGYDSHWWATDAYAYCVSPPDPAIVGERWRELWLARLDTVEPVLRTWLSHQRRDAYWRHGSVGEDYDAIDCPVLMVGGWQDGYRNAVLRTLAGRPETTWGLIGPWAHTWPGEGAPGPAIDYLELQVRWWNRWLRDDDAQSQAPDPRLVVFQQDSRRPEEQLERRPGRWTAFRDWPPQPPVEVVLTGGETALAGTSVDVGWRAEAGIASPLWCPYGDPSDFAADQRADDALAACLEWELDADLEILGNPVARLRIQADAERALVAVRLCHVWPDGASTLVTFGLLNLAHRHGHAAPEPVEQGAPLDVEVTLQAIGYRVPAGHRLRLAITPGYWPMAWPSPAAAGLRIAVDACAVHVPIAPSGGEPAHDLGDPGEPAAYAPGEFRRRRVERSFGDGDVLMRFAGDSGVHRFDDGSSCRICDDTDWFLRSGDPLSARTTTTVTMERARPGWDARLETSSSLHAGADAFHVEVSVCARADGELLRERTFSWSIPRDHL